MRRIAITIVAAALISPSTASAGLALGLGTGLSRTGGEVFEGAKVRDYTGSMVPVQLEAGWKFARRLTLTGFATMNVGAVSGTFRNVCDAQQLRCLANQTRLGGLARWNFRPDGRLDPWAGAGVAWEVLGIESTSGTTSAVTTNYQGTGWDVQAGFDYWMSRRLSVSPYLGLSFGTYTEGKLVSSPMTDWEPIAGQKMHTLFTAGVRLGFDLGGTPRAPASPASPASPDPE